MPKVRAHESPGLFRGAEPADCSGYWDAVSIMALPTTCRSTAPEPDDIETAVDQAIAVCDGDVRAALRAALIYNEFLERKLDQFRSMVSSGYTRGQISPARRASEKVDDWREISSGTPP